MAYSEKDALKRYFNDTLKGTYKGFTIQLKQSMAKEGTWLYYVSDPELPWHERELGAYHTLDAAMTRCEGVLRKRAKIKPFNALFMENRWIVNNDGERVYRWTIRTVEIIRITPGGEMKYRFKGEDDASELLVMRDYEIKEKLFADTPDNRKALDDICNKLNYLDNKRTYTLKLRDKLEKVPVKTGKFESE